MNTKNLFLAFSLFIVGSIFAASPTEAPKVLYLYGDVAADGSIPSGEAKPFHQMRLIDTGARGMSGFAEAIREIGFEIDEAYDAEIQLTPEFLSGIDVLILGSNQRRFSQVEAETLNAWVRRGGGLLAWNDSAFGGHWAQVGVANEAGRLSLNDLTTQFGMFFMTDNGAGNYLVEEFEADHFLNAGNRDGGIRFRGEGVSPVRVSPPATLLARMQAGGLGGGLRLNKKDGELDIERDAALAIAEIGKGRVVGVFDRNLFWNAGEGTRLSHVDNREFTQRIVAWAAKEENAVVDAQTIQPTGDSGSQFASQLNISARTEVDAGERTVLLIAEVTDGQGVVLTPEVTWSTERGSQPLEFANNNPNGARILANYSTPGDYIIRLRVQGSGYSFVQQLKVELP